MSFSVTDLAEMAKRFKAEKRTVVCHPDQLEWVEAAIAGDAFAREWWTAKADPVCAPDRMYIINESELHHKLLADWWLQPSTSKEG